MHPLRRPLHTLPLALAALVGHGLAPAHAQCVSTITADVSVVSVTAGGVQNLGLTVPPAAVFSPWHLVGSLSGTSPGSPYYAVGGIFLNEDRYTRAMIGGASPLVHGGLLSPHGIVPMFDAQGQASLQVVVPPMLYAALIGRTAHHAFFRLDPALLPDCGSNTVALTFVP